MEDYGIKLMDYVPGGMMRVLEDGIRGSVSRRKILVDFIIILKIIP